MSIAQVLVHPTLKEIVENLFVDRVWAHMTRATNHLFSQAQFVKHRTFVFTPIK